MERRGRTLFVLSFLIIISGLFISVYITTSPSSETDIRREAAALDEIPAFPGAEGFGSTTPGGRGGQVIEVTNLNDSGNGSLRKAINTDGSRIIVFRVSGNIDLKSPLIIVKPHITIAGQTASGDGICIRDNVFEVQTHDVIIRYLRFRLGDRTRKEVDSLTIRNAQDVIIDHCSASWSIDEVFSVVQDKGRNPPTDNITVQWNIIAEALDDSYHSKGNHGYGSIMGGNFKGTYNQERVGRISLHHNLYAHNRQRNPRVAAKEDEHPGVYIDIRNNVVYNWRNRAGENGEKQYAEVNYINNYFKPGPSTRPNAKKVAFYPKSSRVSMYMQGNFLLGFPEGNENNWKMTLEDRIIKLNQALEAPIVTTYSALTAYDKVLQEVGAIKPKRDSADARIINSVMDGTGSLVNSQNDVGGWPDLQSSTPPTDSDHDGMPDNWEDQYSLNPNDYSDNSEDPDSDGYTNIEEYLNNTAPAEACTSDCSEKECGEDDGCGNKCDGSCPKGEKCKNYQCVKISQCQKADMNNDQFINMYDVSFIINNWKWKYGQSTNNLKADTNDDDKVNMLDLSSVLGCWKVKL